MAKLKTGRHTSAIKSHRQSLRRWLRNKATKRKARFQAKATLAAIAAKDSGKIQELLPSAASAWDKAAKQGTIHWKAAARKKSRLAAQAQAALAAKA